MNCPASRTMSDLIASIVASSGDDAPEAWAAVSALHERGDREAFVAACALCADDNSQNQVWGIRILAQLGVPERRFPTETVALLLDMLARERKPEVIAQICIALGHQHTIAAIDPLAALRHHPDPEVRYGIVYGLLAHVDDRAVEALIELSADAEAKVRDWATFGLGVQIDLDTPAIRAALVARLEDEDEETRGEALVGLARRKDKRVLAPLLRELSAVVVSSLAVEAARILGDRRLLPALYALRKRQGGYDRDVEEAIARCAEAQRVAQ